ncbi:cell division protein DivIC [Evansella vedderi]|uniref:Cell division protein DivIC n=1 Tax=Evansella vedderi TaxID=38282 RepID=A0ABU0A305_9BACI|nr:septum formation initiator family protein [Evansella vedderi]MDQ0257872.1 cell division protein DivIC [Evansella vedderi]
MSNNPKANIRRLTSEYMEKHSILQEQNLRRKKGLIRRLTVYGVLMVIFIAFIGNTLYNQQQTIQEQEKQKKVLEEELLVLQNTELDLREEIQLLHDPEYIAEIARRDFYLTKPGETLFQLPRSSTSTD